MQYVHDPSQKCEAQTVVFESAQPSGLQSSLQSGTARVVWGVNVIATPASSKEMARSFSFFIARRGLVE